MRKQHIYSGEATEGGGPLTICGHKLSMPELRRVCHDTSSRSFKHVNCKKCLQTLEWMKGSYDYIRFSATYDIDINPDANRLPKHYK